MDYSYPSIQLCKAIQEKENVENVAFETLDLLDNKQTTKLGKKFNLVLDKGTFDAISLMKRTDEMADTPSSIYVQQVNQIMDKGSILLITSCNWTEEELVKRFSKYFSFHDRIKYPTFQFGGTFLFFS